MKFIPYGRQHIDSQDIESVAAVLTSDFLTTGPKVKAFEEKIAAYCHTEYAVAVANGTAALHLASLALLEPGDIVLTTPNSFLATANAILYAGAIPVFIDIQHNGNIDLDLCEAYLENEPAVKAIYGVHFSGNPLEQEKLARIRSRFGVIVLEDCAHSIGAKYDGVQAGSCTHADCSVFSFHPVKHLTTGEGGAITTNSQTLYEKLLQLRNHGMTRDAAAFADKKMAYDEKGNLNPWYYEMQTLGYNYRITDFQCALGLSQFGKLDAFIARRRALAKAYDQAFSGDGRVEPLYPYTGESSYHLYVVRVDFGKVPVTRAEFFVKMRDCGIGLQLHYIPINKQPYYRGLGYGSEATPVMDRYYQQCLSLPMYPDLSDEEQKYVIDTFYGALNG